MSIFYENCIIKGIVNSELTPEMAVRLGRAAAFVLAERAEPPIKFLVGRDTRISGDMIQAAFSAGLCSGGVRVMSAGVSSAAAVSYLIGKYKTAAGAVISAGSLDVRYNGITLLDGNGKIADSTVTDKVVQYMNENRMPGTDIWEGTITRSHTALRDYVDHVKSVAGPDLSGLKIAIDAANGAAYQSAKLIFKELGADVEMLSNIPNGININESCGVRHLDVLQSFVPSHNCDFGIALGGDGTELAILDENGNLLNDIEVRGFCPNPSGCGNAVVRDGIVCALGIASEYLRRGIPMSELAGRK